MRKILLFISVVFGLFSCSTNTIDDPDAPIAGIDHQVTENIEGGSVTYKYNEGVIVINKTNSKLLQKIEADTILYFSKSAARKFDLSEGNIISSGLVNDITPYGLGNRILSVSDNGDLIRCVTTSAPLDEIFEVLDIDANIQLFTDTISQKLVDSDGNTVSVEVEQKQDVSRASIGSPNILTINLGNKSNDTRVGPYLTGSMSLGAIATLDLNLKERKSECSLALYAGFDGEVGTQATWSGYKKLLPRKGKWNIVTGVVAIGPVVLRPFIDAELGLQGKIEGTISTKMSKQFGGKFGFKNGDAFHENLTNSSTDIVKNISIDAKGEVGIVTKLNFGMGLYTKNIAVGIDPSISAGFSTDFKLNNENLFRNHPNLDFKVTADADAFFYAEFFGKEFSHAQASLASIELFSHSWPLLPSLVENSLEINKRKYDGPLMFDAAYKLQGGLLTDLSNKLGNHFDAFTIMPTFRVYRGGNEVYHIINAQEIKGSGTQKFEFELGDLEHDISYTGKPCIIIGNKMYDEDGIPFSSTSPTAAITDIVQTGAANGSFEHNGGTYDYEFYFYVNAQIKGSDNCKEWGIYDPRSENTYYPEALNDGRVTQYWTAWSNNPSATFTKTPYVILKDDGKYKYFEQHSHSLYYGGYFASPAKKASPRTKALKTIKQGDLIMRLDSVKYEKFK